jgi:hypothetical protein
LRSSTTFETQRNQAFRLPSRRFRKNQASLSM